MTPKEVLEMRNKLSSDVYVQFGNTLSLIDKSDVLADWLIGYGWVTGVPDDNTD